MSGEYRFGETFCSVPPEVAQAIADGASEAYPGCSSGVLLEVLASAVAYVSLKAPPGDRGKAFDLVIHLLEHAKSAVEETDNPAKKDNIKAGDVAPEEPNRNSEQSKMLLGLVSHAFKLEDPKAVIQALASAIVFACWFHTTSPRQSLALLRDTFDEQISKVPDGLAGPVS
jgi:hypothetical protein